MIHMETKKNKLKIGELYKKTLIHTYIMAKKWKSDKLF